MSKTHLRLSKSVAANTDIYINECLQPKLLAFIHKHHSDFNYLFWPDLAKAHYSAVKHIMRPWHRRKKMYTSSKGLQPSKCSSNKANWELMVTENCILAQKVNEEGWQTSTQQELISHIQSQLKKLTQIFYKTSWKE